jgi:hypothetical protein
MIAEVLPLDRISEAFDPMHGDKMIRSVIHYRAFPGRLAGCLRDLRHAVECTRERRWKSGAA